MSASRDKTQRFTFVYSNLYQLFKKEGKAKEAPASLNKRIVSGHVIKAEDLHRNRPGSATPAPRVEPFRPVTFLKPPPALKQAEPLASTSPNTILASAALSPLLSPSPIQSPYADTLAGLKQNLQALNGLHDRLRFMLKELEELVKED